MQTTRNGVLRAGFTANGTLLPAGICSSIRFGRVVCLQFGSHPRNGASGNKSCLVAKCLPTVRSTLRREDYPELQTWPQLPDFRLDVIRAQSTGGRLSQGNQLVLLFV